MGNKTSKSEGGDMCATPRSNPQSCKSEAVVVDKQVQLAKIGNDVLRDLFGVFRIDCVPLCIIEIHYNLHYKSDEHPDSIVSEALEMLRDRKILFEVPGKKHSTYRMEASRQENVRDGLEEDELESIYRRVYNSILRVVDSYESDLGWNAIDFDLGHYLHDLGTQLHNCEVNSSAARLFHQLGMFKWHAEQELGQAVEALETSITLLRSYDQELEEVVASTLNTKATILFHMGNVDGAIAARREALDIREHLFGKGSEAYAEILLNLGADMREKGDMDTAVSFVSQALNVFKEKLEPMDNRLALALNNLGLCHRVKDEFAEAQKCYEGALNILTENGTKQVANSEVADVYANLGAVSFNSGDVESAIIQTRAAQRIYDNIAGKKTLRSCMCDYNMATYFDSFERTPEAIQCVESAIEGYLGIVGHMHPDVGAFLVLHGSLLQNIGRFDDACSNLRKALHIYSRFYDEEHPRVVEARRVLSVVLNSRRTEHGTSPEAATEPL